LNVIYVDTFGNIKLSGVTNDLVEALGTLTRGEELVIEVGAGNKPKSHQLKWASTFGEVAPGEPLLYEDSYGRLCIAVNQGNAARQIGLVDDEVLAISRPRLPAIHHGADEAAGADEGTRADRPARAKAQATD
jgi:S-adenosylmethionine hydrolase